MRAMHVRSTWQRVLCRTSACAVQQLLVTVMQCTPPVTVLCTVRVRTLYAAGFQGCCHACLKSSWPDAQCRGHHGAAQPPFLGVVVALDCCTRFTPVTNRLPVATAWTCAVLQQCTVRSPSEFRVWGSLCMFNTVWKGLAMLVMLQGLASSLILAITMNWSYAWCSTWRACSVQGCMLLLWWPTPGRWLMADRLLRCMTMRLVLLCRRLV